MFGFQFSNQLRCTLVVTVTAAQNVASAVDAQIEVPEGSSESFQFSLEFPQNVGQLTFVIGTQDQKSSSQGAELTFNVGSATSGGNSFVLQKVDSALLINVSGGDAIPASLTTLSFADFSNALLVLITLPDRVDNCMC